MIPVHLEKMIWEGKGVYKHAVLGGSSTSVLTVARTAPIVIYEIICYHFINSQTGLDSAARRLISQMEFRQVESSVGTHFMLKSDLNHEKTFNGLVDGTFSSGHTTFHPYLIFNNDVVVSFLRNPVLPWTLTTGTTDSIELNALKVPNGPSPSKGQAMASNILELDYNDVLPTSNVPVDVKYRPGGVPATYNGLKFPYNDDTLLDNQLESGATEALNTYPIVNISYVQMREALTSKIQQT